MVESAGRIVATGTAGCAAAAMVMYTKRIQKHFLTAQMYVHLNSLRFCKTVYLQITIYKSVKMDASIQQHVDKWLNGAFDESVKEEIRKLEKNNPDELADAFYRSLEFGTGGLRGLMGVGINRMNKYTVGMATQGYANYLKKSFPNEEVRVAIAHDSRNNSRFFAETAAHVFAANGIKVFLFEDLRPTPELSFTIRRFKCQGGVVCTASHNPREYNG
jgi:phosphoglucomutase